jgi:polar amino acid transport system substrate-binding protein
MRLSAPSRVVRSLLAALLLAVVAGCTGPLPDEQSTAAMPTSTYPPTPTPSGAQFVPLPAALPEPPDETCDPTASWRPPAEMPKPGEMPPGSPMARIFERGVLVVGLDAGSNLFSFRDPVTGDLVGFDVDIAREVARDIFGDPGRVEFRILTSAQREQALQRNEVDIVVKTMTITCDRATRVEFSIPYFQAYQRILTVKGSGIGGVADLAGRTVCVVNGTTSLMRIQRLQPTAAILGVPSWADCLVALQQRQADAISTDDAILAGLNAQDPFLHLVGARLSSEPYGIGMNKENIELVRFVNGTLERIRNDGTWTASYEHWLSVLGPSPGMPPGRYHD